MLKRLAHPPRYYYYMFAMLIIALAIIIQSLRMLAPQVDRLRPSIERFLSEEINARVSIGEIQGSWYGLRPHVLVKNLAVENVDSVVGLRIGYADFTLDLLKSALQSQWVWRQVKFDDIYIELSQNKQGQWHVGGLPVEQKTDSRWHYRSPAELFQTVSKIDLNNADIHIIFANKKAIRSQIPSIKIENDGGFHRLTALASVNNTDMFEMVLEQNEPSVDSDLGLQPASSITGFVALKNFPLQTIVNGILSDDILNKDALQESTINSSLWFDFSSQQGFDVVGDVSVNNLSSSPYLRSFAINSSVTSDVHGHFDANSGWSLGLRDLTISNPDIVQQVLLQKSDNGLQLMIDELQINEWMTWLMPRVNDKTKRIVETISPSGRVSQVTVDVDFEDWKSSRLLAYVHDISAESFENIPGIRHVNGFLSSGVNGGYVNINTQGLELEPTQVYEQALVFDDIQGQVAWHLLPESNQIIVNSSRLLTESSFGRASGVFYLDVPWEKDSRKSDFVLQVGLQDSSYEKAKHLIPYRVPESLRNWLDSSVLAGDAQQAGFTYRGGFSGGDHVRSIQLFFDVQNVDLHYSDDWPDLMKASGRVLVDNQFTQVETTEAFVKDESVDNLVVTWLGDERKELNVDVRSQVSAQLGLYFLNNTWLQSKVGETFSSWSGEGNIYVSVNVDIPLFETAKNSGIESKQQVQISFSDNVFHLPDQRLDFSNVSGDLYFSNSKGLYSDNLSLTLFGNKLPLRVTQTPQVSRENESAILIKGRSTIASKDLSSWLEMPELSYLSGQLPYDVQLDIPLKDNKDYVAKLSMKSDLLGVNSQFPAPLSKAKSERRDFSLTALINPLESLYTLHLDDVFQAEFILADTLQSGLVVLGKTEPLTEPLTELAETTYAKDKLTVKARLDTANVDEWSNLLAYSQEVRSAKNTEQANHTSLADLPIQYDIRIKQLRIKDTDIPNVQLMGNKQGDDWRTDITNDWLKAQVKFDGEFVNPIEVSFDYLHIPSKEKEELAEKGSDEPTASNIEQKNVVEVDPLADFDLSLVKSAVVDIQSLTYKDRPLGQWRFTVNPKNGGVSITDIYGEFSGLRLSGKEEGTGASLEWLAKNNETPVMTQLTANLSGGGIQQLFEDWGYPAPLTSQSTLFDINTSWQGSPAFFSIGKMEGNVYTELQEGVFVQGKGNAATGVLRLFGLFNFNTWARRLKLDFSDVYKKGVAFDSLTSRLVFDEGFIYFQEPLLLKGPASEFTMAGKIDYPNENIDAVLVATLPVGGNLTFAAAFAGGLPAAAGVYIVSKLFKPQVDKVSSLTYSIKGHWNEPKVAFIRLFDNDTQKGDEAGVSESPLSPPSINDESE